MSTEQQLGAQAAEGTAEEPVVVAEEPAEERAVVAEGAAEDPPAPPAPLIVPQGVQLVLLALGLLALWVAARAARNVVEIIVVASFIALMLNPFVSFLGRRGLGRGLAIPLTYLSLLLILAGIGLALAQPITNQVDAFQRNVPSSCARPTRR